MPPTPVDAAAPRTLALFADLYQMTMARAYFDLGMTARGVFSLFIRRLPPERRFFLAAGLEAALKDLADLRFERADLDYLASLGGRFPDPFLRWLETLRFDGEVRAVAEGTPVFPLEPILEIDAPIAIGQLVETLVMNRIGLETMLASKAARVVAAAEGRLVADFGCRRAHGIDAALRGARAFQIAGVGGGSNMLAGALYGMPVIGTVAHSFVEAFDREEDAFEAFAGVFPGTTLLVDTYDTRRGVARLIEMAARQGDAFNVAAIRIDSGDLGALTTEARAMLDAAGLQRVKIFVSGGLTEYRIAELLAGGAPIDGFGVGTEMSTSSDAPALDIVYKLVAYNGQGRMKLAPGKRTLPGPKQVFRRIQDGVAIGDVIARADERLDGTPLLQPVMKNGAILDGALPELPDIRESASRQISELPNDLKSIAPGDGGYDVRVSAALEADEAEIAGQHGLKAGG